MNTTRSAFTFPFVRAARAPLGLVVATLLLAGCDTVGPTEFDTGRPDPARVQAPREDCTLALAEADVLASLASLRAEIDALEAAGSLNRGQANALRNKLDNAAEALEAGRLCPAAAMVRAFRTQVENFVGAGALTEAEAAPLVDEADRVLGDAPPVFIQTAIAAGIERTCGITSTGTAYCWGRNDYGEIGDGTTTTRLLPTPVSGGLSFKAISVGYTHSCAIAVNGQAWCWGVNGSGQLGDGSTTNRSTPTPVLGGLTFKSIDAGVFHTCGVTESGEGYCWGGNVRGALGNGSVDPGTAAPSPVAGGLTFESIAAAVFHSCGLASGGVGYCWGQNLYGQLGDGTVADSRPLPTPVAGGHTFLGIDTKGASSCGLRSDETAWCWGANTSGGIGDGTTTDRNLPTPVAGGHRFKSLRVAAGQTCGLLTDGSALCWGNNGNGQIGDGTKTDRLTPVAVSGGLTFETLAAGGIHTCGIATDGAAYCWGFNGGRLGDGTTTERLTPTPVSGWTSLF